MDKNNELVKEISTLMKTHPDNWQNKLSDKTKKKLREQIMKKRITDNLKIIKYLNQKKIDYLVLKGISLWYFDRGRDFEDLDILVDPEDVEKTATFLIRDFGYRYDRLEELDFLRNPEQNHAHDVSIIAPKMIPIEIHYRMFNYLDQHSLPLMADKVFLDYEGVKIPCQSKELQLLEAFLHNVYHHFFICDRKKWINDLNIIIGNYNIDWDKFLWILAELKQKEVIYLTVKMLNPKMPPQVLKRLKPVSLLSYIKKPVFIWAAYFVWDRLFPPKGILYQRFHIKENSIFFFLSYPANWIRLVFVTMKLVLKKIF
ncbi:nucleotidyltransferase family protein [Candidatus Micrarchaeota archaeon]|nr:nucleotidyltransferase family protein [Candidatus Micrarchaeota archaeon]